MTRLSPHDAPDGDPSDATARSRKHRERLDQLQSDDGELERLDAVLQEMQRDRRRHFEETNQRTARLARSGDNPGSDGFRMAQHQARRHHEQKLEELDRLVGKIRQQRDDLERDIKRERAKAAERGRAHGGNN